MAIYVIIMDKIPPAMHRIARRLPGIIARAGRIVICEDSVSAMVIAEKAQKATIITAESCNIQRFGSNPISREVCAALFRRGRPRKEAR